MPNSMIQKPINMGSRVARLPSPNKAWENRTDKCINGICSSTPETMAAHMAPMLGSRERCHVTNSSYQRGRYAARRPAQTKYRMETPLNHQTAAKSRDFMGKISILLNDL